MKIKSGEEKLGILTEMCFSGSKWPNVNIYTIQALEQWLQCVRCFGILAFRYLDPPASYTPSSVRAWTMRRGRNGMIPLFSKNLNGWEIPAEMRFRGTLIISFKIVNHVYESRCFSRAIRYWHRRKNKTSDSRRFRCHRQSEVSWHMWKVWSPNNQPN